MLISEEFQVKPEIYACGKHFGPDRTMTLDTIVLCGPSTLFRYKVQGEQIELRATSPEPVTTCLWVLNVTRQSHLSHRLFLARGLWVDPGLELALVVVLSLT